MFIETLIGLMLLVLAAGFFGAGIPAPLVAFPGAGGGLTAAMLAANLFQAAANFSISNCWAAYFSSVFILTPQRCGGL